MHTNVIEFAPQPADLADATVALVRCVRSERHIPLSTYRLQFNHLFTFDQAAGLIDYFNDLGVGDLYSSPIQKARPGSMHGYDICDHAVINPELGGEAAFERLSAALKNADMRMILDIVPNHMAISHPCNAWWMDVLENGPSSIYASYFDIDWRPVNPHLRDKVLLPCLGDQYGAVLESGQIRLVYDSGTFNFYYHHTRLPLAPRTYPMILRDVVEHVAELLGPEHDHVLELRSILTALNYLPHRTTLDSERRAERNREKEIIKRRIAALVNASAEVRDALDETIHAINGQVGDRRSFDRLDDLLEQQPYRPAYWRVAAEEINYRRFFDINELAAISTENPAVFRATHELIFRLLAEDKIHGVRVDHPDGLWDPTDYFHRLQEHYLRRKALARAGSEPPADLDDTVASALAEMKADVDREPWPLYVVAEKILGENEPLPSTWAVHGTSGYDFLTLVNGLFVDSANESAFSQLYNRFIERADDFNELVVTSQRMILRMSMSSELNSLGHELDRISERNRRYRDFTLNSLTFAIREVISCLLIYRTYTSQEQKVDARDRGFILEAIELAKRNNPRFAPAVFDFVRDTLLLDNLEEFREEDRPRLVNWVMDFQQLTGPVIAKALEDTAFYVYNRLASLNEVGGHPRVFGVSLRSFHRRNHERQERWPHSMLTTSTHDTKRSEDVRARISVLSEMPREWDEAINRWSRMNASKKTIVEKRPAPDANDECLLYQTLVGAYPNSTDPAGFDQFRNRVVAYMEKATKEAKAHTSWISPNAEYDAAIRQFCLRLLPDTPDEFLNDFLAFQKPIRFFGAINSLSQVVLKLTCPGVADLYQGNEIWDFSLVDPDNRRPVDYNLRREMLADIRRRADSPDADLAGLCRDLAENWPDGRIKLDITSRLLHLRRAWADLFLNGDYLPIDIRGEHADHVCAFARFHDDVGIFVVTPRLVHGLLGGKELMPVGADVWGDTRLVLPSRSSAVPLRNPLTGETLAPHSEDGISEIPIADILKTLPVAVLRLTTTG